MVQTPGNLYNIATSKCGMSDASAFSFWVNVIRNNVASQLSIPVAAVSLKDNLSNIGLSSLDTIKISRSISELLSINISPAILYGHRNIELLVKYLILRYPIQTEERYKKALLPNQQTDDSAGGNGNRNYDTARYIRSAQLNDYTKRYKCLILLSGSSTQEVELLVGKIRAYIDRFDSDDFDVLKAIELYFLFEHPEFHNRLAITCEDISSLKRNIDLYLSDKHSYWLSSTRAYTHKNVRLFGESYLCDYSMARVLLAANKLDQVAYLWVNQIDINIRSHYYQDHIDKFRPQVNKIRDALFGSGHSETFLPSISNITFDSSDASYDCALERIAGAFFELEELCVYSTKYIFASIIENIASSTTFTLDELIGFFSANIKHARLIAAMAEILVKNGVLDRNAHVYTQVQSVSVYDVKPEAHNERLNLFARNHPELRPHIDLLRATVADTPNILSGKKSAIEVLFPLMSMRLVEPIYRNNVLADYYNRVASLFLDAILARRKSGANRKKITILEIGAGTGGTSTSLFSTLQPYGNEVVYVYTDISAGFVQHGKGHYSGVLPEIKFRTLDIEANPSEQYKELLGSADVVISANAVHATSDIRRAVSNIRALMKPGGVVILNEVVAFQVYSTLTFGLLEGWWLYEDSEIRIPNSPLLSAKTWSDVLKSCGFRSIVSGNDCLNNKATAFQDIIVAQLE
jgi:SAM-dependent methyltransferase/acyl carrier protein